MKNYFIALAGYKKDDQVMFRVCTEEQFYKQNGFLIDYEVPGWKAAFTLEEASIFISKLAYKAALKTVMDDYLAGKKEATICYQEQK